jgi:hypothetical protein
VSVSNSQKPRFGTDTCFWPLDSGGERDIS